MNPTDLALDPQRQLQIKDGDLALLYDWDCLHANLTDCLLTAKGGLLYHPDFGADLPVDIGNLSTAEYLNLITTRARIEILKDPRVKEVISCIPVETNNTILLTITLKLQDDSSLNLTLNLNP